MWVLQSGNKFLIQKVVLKKNPASKIVFEAGFFLAFFWL